MEKLGQKQANIQTPNPLDIEPRPRYRYVNGDDVDEKTKLWNSLNVSSLSHTFDSFKGINGTEDALKTFQEIGDLTSDRKFILIVGTTGSGKTHLIEATVIAWAIKHNIITRYYTMSQIVRVLKNGMASQPPTYNEIFRKLCETSKLVIDDVGMGSIESKWEISELEDIVNERYHTRYKTNKITILASNKDIKELPDRIVSRFYDPEFGKVILIKSGDYRRRKVK